MNYEKIENFIQDKNYKLELNSIIILIIII